MIWGSAGRQHAWLAVGARTFALLSLVLPLILKNNQLLLLALLAMGAIWAAVTAGEVLGLPATLLLVLDAALVGSVAGLSSHSTTAILGAVAVPPFTAGLSRGLRGVALSLSAELAAYVVVVLSTSELDQVQGSAAFTWAVTGLGLGLIAAFVRRTFLQVNDPQRAYRDAQALIRELITLSGKLSSGLDPVALGGQIASSVRDELPVSALTVHIPRGDVLTPLVGDSGIATPELTVSDELAQYSLMTGNVRVVGHSFAFPLNSGGGVAAVVSGVLAPGLDPQAMDLPRRLSALDRRLSPATVRLDTAVLFLAFRDSATVEERRRLAREMHDGVAQEMASLGYFVDTLVDQEPADSTRARQLTLLRERLTMVVGEVRRSVQTLRTEIGESDSLGTAIGSLARHLSASSGIPIHVTLDEQTTRLRPEIESELLRIAQEAMTNAVRHSGASSIAVRCSVAPPLAEIVVSDNGRGLGSRRDDSHGLEIMRERAALIDADLQVDDQAPHGTTVAVHLPAPACRIRTNRPNRARFPHDRPPPTHGGHMSTDAPPLRVLIVDDHELVREGLVGAFAREEGTEVSGSVGTVAEAVAAYRADRPDVIVTDLQLQDGTGLDIIRQVRQSDEKVGLVVVTMHSGDDQIFAAMEAGASAFVGKDAPSTEVVRAARHAAVSPRSFLCTGLSGAMMRRMSAESTRLSTREHEVLLLLADGANAAAIGQQLYMSESTVKSHIARIYQKLGAQNRAQALVTAMRIGLLSTVQRPTT